MSRYSKALEYDYSAQLRRDLINETTVHCRPAIDGAIAMLGSAAQTVAVARKRHGPRRRKLMYRILQIMSAEEVEQCRQIAASAPFVDGQVTNPHNLAKQNEQLHDRRRTRRAHSCSAAR